jgi:magnesium transporter
MVPALAGNIGIQCSTVTLRYIVTGNIAPARIRSRIIREVGTGMVLAIIIAALTGLGVFGYIFITAGQMLLGWAITIAMLIAIVLAALFGTFSPIACDKMNIDPAIAAGPFITMLNDIFGVGVYLITALIFIQFL